MTTEEVVRQSFRAYETGDADALHALLAEGFTFSAPPDPHLDKDGYIRRCWPFHHQKPCYQFEEFFVRGEHAFVLYTCTVSAGKKIRNAEYFVVRGEKVASVTVFFGPDAA